MEYNYFSTARLKAAPGVIVTDAAYHKVEGGNEDNGLLETVGRRLGLRRRQQFFSLPGTDLSLFDPDTRLKLSLFEDNGLSAGFDLIADSCFTVSDLRERKLGDSSAIKMQANVVGKAQLKYVECGDDPRYFCLSLIMQSIQ